MGQLAAGHTAVSLSPALVTLPQTTMPSPVTETVQVGKINVESS